MAHDNTPLSSSWKPKQSLTTINQPPHNPFIVLSGGNQSTTLTPTTTSTTSPLLSQPPPSNPTNDLELTPLFPPFLHPTQFTTHLQTFRQTLSSTPHSPHNPTFAPLTALPLPIAHRLVSNTFTSIFPPESTTQILTLPSFLRHLSTQYSTSPLSPADNPARWVLINSIIALCVRYRTVPDSGLGDVVKAFYGNATKVLSSLILPSPESPPSLLAVQALLSMALFVFHSPDTKSFVMLATNASRLLELLGLKNLRRGKDIDQVVAGIDFRGMEMELEEYEMVCKTANMFDKTMTEYLSSESTLQSTLHDSSEQGIVL